jgi:hypothetical protein
MRRYIFLLIMLLPVVSCSQMIVPEPAGADRILCLNARLYTADTLHTVSACYGCRTGVEPAPGTVVVCFVNGLRVDEAVADSLGDAQLRARIEPGDIVCVTADAPLAPSVSAKTVAPLPPVIGHAGIGLIEGYQQVRLQVADNSPEEDYFVVKLYEDNVVYNQDGGEVVLQERSPSLVRGEQGHVFSDHAFAGAAKTMNISCDSNRYSYLYKPYGSYDYEVSEKQRFALETSMRLRLCSLCAEDYWTSFLLSGDSWDGFENPLDQIGSAMVYPCNVDGGAGLVAVRSCAEVVLPYAEVIMDGSGRILSDRYLF